MAIPKNAKRPAAPASPGRVSMRDVAALAGVSRSAVSLALQGHPSIPLSTRESIIALLRERGVTMTERRITIDEIRAAHAAGTLREVFGTGTAAVVSPVGALGFADGDLQIGDGQPGEFARLLHDEIVAIQRLETPDRFGWTHDVP